MKAIILAAGRGSRMKSLTEERPKCLINLRGSPLLEWQIKAIRAAGIKEIAIVTGYRKELLNKYNLVKFHNENWFETDMVASLACAKIWLQSGPCIISYSDIFYDTSAVVSLTTCSESLAITYDPNWLSIWKKRFDDPLTDAETFKITSLNQISEIGNKPKCLDEIKGQFMGLLKITPESWSEIDNMLAEFPKSISDKMQITDLLQNLIKRAKLPIIGLPYEGEWGEIDTNRDLKVFEEKIL